jgi:hypothetical protein
MPPLQCRGPAIREAVAARGQARRLPGYCSQGRRTGEALQAIHEARQRCAIACNKLARRNEMNIAKSIGENLPAQNPLTTPQTATRTRAIWRISSSLWTWQRKRKENTRRRTRLQAASRKPKVAGPSRGAGAKGSGSPRRLALIANQLSLTYDIHDMPVNGPMKLLPEEFGTKWR